MSTVHLRGIDLNLLVPLHALLEERNVTRAAKRIHLTQSAMSRALERLREALRDDLLVRSGGQYELTPRAEDLLQELALLVPRLEQFWRGDAFFPETTSGRMRLAMTDYAAAVVLPHLIAACARQAPGLAIEVVPWHERSYEDLGAAKVDLVFSPLAVPQGYCIETLFQERFVCLSGKRLVATTKSLSLARFMHCRHISVETEPNQQNLIDRALAELGLRRTVSLRLPFLLPAIQVLLHSDLLLTTPLRLARLACEQADLHIVQAPAELPTFQYASVWHPRLQREPMQAWFRLLVTQICKQHLAHKDQRSRPGNAGDSADRVVARKYPMQKRATRE
ncbi:LysR family transcriptional regulator [Acidipila sp. EB88]|uniref:LysR family transcriptional regulator n=1 Tax=Acidipila sp. EB88 TaxID=2305226 RepID=UPI0013151D48